eukprot:CAMPEP_0196721336 /NCGR_PEP_ID=MMETSP1091-20130531/3930_1 /TAXON_ID=302021 /ORGANISM="Rhodomonas sp., Strain CCMP768" /LENGTH=149 /DNA_ID=CAMNT_0042062785 /DNA_START=262 /DNA_END=710 /DNA_ORIENTATION=+
MYRGVPAIVVYESVRLSVVSCIDDRAAPELFRANSLSDFVTAARSVADGGAAGRERAGRGRDQCSTASAEAEVRKFEHSMVTRQHQVCWLEIAVHDARLDPMQERQRIKELDGPRQGLVQRNSSLATEERHTTLEEVFEVSTFHELQNK